MDRGKVSGNTPQDRREWALSGEQTGMYRRTSEKAEERELWAYISAKTPQELSAGLAEETNPHILGELIEKCWGTDLSTVADLERGIAIGGRARMSAVVDARCPKEQVRAFIKDWAADPSLVSPFRPEVLLGLLAGSHPGLLGEIMESAPESYLAGGEGIPVVMPVALSANSVPDGWR